jgi:uncharacterized membrane protein
MLSNLKLAYKFASNIANIKLVIESVYNVVVKVSSVLDVISSQLDASKTTKLGVVIAQYLPIVSSALTKIKSTIEKYGPLVGIETTVYVQENEDAAQALIDALKELDHATLD